MKVLYINNYRGASGWSVAGENYILALDAAGIDVVPRFLNLGQTQRTIHPRVMALERKDSYDCDVIIQHVLPNMLDYRGEVDKNIALYVTETDNFRKVGWADHINLMDEAWVPCRDSVLSSERSGVYIPISQIPHACDPSIYSQYYKKIDFPELRNKFVFYFIGEITRRKNLSALLKAFHLEFAPDEPVGLLIKGNMPGVSDKECADQIIEMSNTVKTHLKKYKKGSDYAGEVVIAQRLTDDQIMQVHTTCDCFVMPSYGEAWCIPAFDAMAMGKTPICTATGGPADYIEKPVVIENALGESTIKYELCGWLVGGQMEPCFGMVGSAVPDLYSGDENWLSVNILQLRQAMREAFENKEEKSRRAANGIDRAYEFSYRAIGHRMKEHLEYKPEVVGIQQSSYQFHNLRGML